MYNPFGPPSIHSNGVLDFAQVAHLKSVIDDKGIKIPLFTEPDGRLYKREVATYDHVTSDPLLPDPYESRMIECKRSRVRELSDDLTLCKFIKLGKIQ